MWLLISSLDVQLYASVVIWQYNGGEISRMETNDTNDVVFFRRCFVISSVLFLCSIFFLWILQHRPASVTSRSTTCDINSRSMFGKLIYTFFGLINTEAMSSRKVSSKWMSRNDIHSSNEVKIKVESDFAIFSLFYGKSMTIVTVHVQCQCLYCITHLSSRADEFHAVASTYLAYLSTFFASQFSV